MPDLALMVSDVLLAFDHFTHTVTVLANVFADGGDDLDARYAEAVAAIVDVRERLSEPVPRAAAGVREPPDVRVEHGLRRLRPGGRAREGVHPRRRRLPGGAVAALVGRRAGRGVLRLPRPARDQPEPVHVLPRLRGLPDRRRVARGARHRDRPARGAAADRRHAPARGDDGGGPAPRRRPARRREGARRARDARRPRPQRPRSRVRVRHGDGRRADGRGDLLARDAHRRRRCRACCATA